MIPNVFHFIFGLEKDFGNRPFSIVHYLAIKSAHDINKPTKIFLYYKYLPVGEWWEKTKTYVKLVEIEVPNQIFGNKLYHYAHKSDILRIMLLIKYGGIYLDMDTICLKSFDQLLNYECVMAEETYLNQQYGLCNAVILSTKNSTFMKYWYSSYKVFRSKGVDAYWSEHSVRMPLQISSLYPSLINIIEEDAFFFPSYNQYDLQLLFEKCVYFPKAYVIHLWESQSYDKYLRHLTEFDIMTKDTSYNIIARTFL